MSRSIVENIDVLTHVPQTLTPQQHKAREERLAKALRENLLKRKEQMRARLATLEASLNSPLKEEA